jgi:hypothetical protein
MGDNTAMVGIVAAAVVCVCCSVSAGIALSMDAEVAATKKADAAATPPTKKTVTGHKVKLLYAGPAKTYPGNIINLAELQVFDKDDKNISHGKTVTGTPGVHPAGPFDRLTDGNMTNFAHTLGDGVASMTVNLGSDNEIKKIVITNRTDCCSNRAKGIKVQILDKDDKMVKETATITEDAKVYTYDFTVTDPKWVSSAT